MMTIISPENIPEEVWYLGIPLVLGIIGVVIIIFAPRRLPDEQPFCVGCGCTIEAPLRVEATSICEALDVAYDRGIPRTGERCRCGLVVCRRVVLEPVAGSETAWDVTWEYVKPSAELVELRARLEKLERIAEQGGHTCS